jgi:hypothetical protein
MKCKPAMKCYRKFSREFQETIQNLVNKMRNGMLVDRKQQELTEENLDDIGVLLERLPLKPLMHLVQVTGVSKETAELGQQLFK